MPLATPLHIELPRTRRSVPSGRNPWLRTGNPWALAAGWYVGACRTTLILLVIVWPVWPCPGNSDAARGADEYVLSHGGVVRAELRRPIAAEDTHVEFVLPSGGTITLARQQIRDVRRPSPHLDEYHRRAESLAGTVEAHWELAAWCQTHELEPQYLLHLYRVIELEPNHVEARRLLGYVHVQGEWTRLGVKRRMAGYERYRGKWRTQQEIQLIEEREAITTAQREWVKRLKRWRQSISSPKPQEVQTAIARVRAIDDPMAIDPLTAMLMSEPLRSVKLLYVDVLASIDHDRAIHQLIYVSLVDPDIEVFHTCLDKVVARRLHTTVPTYVKALRNVVNARVNRAAVALKRLGDDEAVEPLIEALVTMHSVQVTPGSHPDSMTFGFLRQPAKDAAPFPSDMGPGGSFSTRRKAEFVRVAVPNQDVLSALVALSGGVSFGFDQPTWRRWQAARRQFDPSFSARREANANAP